MAPAVSGPPPFGLWLTLDKDFTGHLTDSSRYFRLGTFGIAPGAKGIMP